MLAKLLPRHLSDYLEFLLFLKMHDSLLDLIIPRLLVVLSALLHCLSDLVEPTNDILSNFKLKLVDILVLNVLYGCPYEVLVHALAQEGTGLKDESHFLFS